MSQLELGVTYLVDMMKLGVCSCIAGQDGSLCSHQSAIVLNFKVSSINCEDSAGIDVTDIKKFTSWQDRH